MPKGNWKEFDFSESTLHIDEVHQNQRETDLQVRVQKIKGGRNGKIVTLITGLAIDPKEAKTILKRLKSTAGTGGTFKKDQIELQGDQVKVAIKFLQNEGFLPKQSGG